ncbi:MAG: pyridoxamine 5'-phosphate oxidase family protein [Planctomycetota bacterium]|nr:pyridoxamine 5'-phosphate oxidase family protein [Planctomycetota bacterium]
MDDPRARARDYLDRRTSIGMLATVDPQGVPETCILIAPNMVDDDHVAGGEEKDVAGNTFRNLRQRPRATLVVLDPVMDPRARDGVRMHLEFLGAEEDGDALGELSRWLESFAPGRQVVRRLLFKVLKVENYRPRESGPVLLQ